MSVEVSIICDRCARLIAAAKTAAKARAENVLMGGKSRPPHDYCSDCVTSPRQRHSTNEED